MTMRRRKGKAFTGDDALAGDDERDVDWLLRLERELSIDSSALRATWRGAEDGFVQCVAHHEASLRHHGLVYTQALGSPAVGAKLTESE